jgi:hypothetical protein
MSFNTHAKRVRSEALPISYRHVALRSCVERFCPLGFQKTWAILEHRFGLKQGQASAPQSLLQAVSFLEDWRQAWLLRQAAEAAFRREQKRLQLPRCRSPRATVPSA